MQGEATKQEAGAFLFALKNMHMSPSKDKHSHVELEKQASTDTFKNSASRKVNKMRGRRQAGALSSSFITGHFLVLL